MKVTIGMLLAVAAFYIYIYTSGNCMTFIPHRLVCSFPAF